MSADRRRILALALPASLEVGFQTLLGVVDLMMIGHLGQDAIAGVGLVNTMVFLLLLSLGTIGAGGSVLVAQWFGQGDARRVSQYSGQILLAGLVAGLAVGAGLASGGAELLMAVGADPAAAAAGAGYLRIVGGSFPLALLTLLTSEVLRATGDSRMPLLVMGATLALNTALNWLLIFGVGPFPALGAEGAAIATALARLIGLAALATYLFRGHLFGARPPQPCRPADALRFERTRMAELAAIAWPVTVGESLWALGTFLYTVMYAKVGQAALAASQVSGTIEGFFIMTAFGLSIAGLALVGQDLGAGRREQAHETAARVLRIGLWLSLVVGVGMALFALAVPALYPTLGAEAEGLLVLGLLVMAPTLPVRIANMVFGNGILRGGGDARWVMMTDATVMFAVGVPVAWLFGIELGYGFFGVFAGRVAEEAARLVSLYGRWRSGRWARTLTAAPAE
ncbi:MAG TPA: MATE family efflux transporter [Alphaproteobacteria bacterium]|nr:MATE family efflux transporter [Alphaproteobacteria bacterium]